MARQDPYLYEDVPVLRNLPGIKNSEALKQAEGDLTKMSMGIVYAREYEKFNTDTPYLQSSSSPNILLE